MIHSLEFQVTETQPVMDIDFFLVLYGTFWFFAISLSIRQQETMKNFNDNNEDGENFFFFFGCDKKENPKRISISVFFW